MWLFVPTSPFEGFGEHPYDPSTLSHLLAGLIVIVSVGALTLTLYRVVLMLFVGEPLADFLNQLPPIFLSGQATAHG